METREYMKIKPFGILMKSDNVVNHRSLLKVLLNPILRCFGYQLGSYFLNGNFERYEFMRTEIQPNIFRNYYRSLFTCNDYDTVKLNHWLI